MLRDVRTGLSKEPKELSTVPKYFYDAEGSRLFEEITQTPEYYKIGAEFSISRGRSGEIISRTGCQTLIELGSGSSGKTRALLDALLESNHLARYVQLDVSESALEESGERLTAGYPNLEIQSYVGNFDRSLPGPLKNEAGPGGRLVLFLGGTISNFSSEKRREFLQTLRRGLDSGDHLVVGVDFIKDRETLEAAYDDAEGVTARFNKNLLNVLNYRLGANFDLSLFDHRATYDEDHQRIGMWLDFQDEQRVNIPALKLDVCFGREEGMRTEVSAKFSPETSARMFEEADMELLDLYTDD